MDRSKVMAVILAHADPLVDFLGITDWRVYWEMNHLEGDAGMMCDSSLLDYKRANITVDERGYDDEATILDHMFHELAHVLHASFTNYRLTCEALCQPVTDQVLAVEKRAWSHASEGFVLRMEWLRRNHLRTLYLDRFTSPD